MKKNITMHKTNFVKGAFITTLGIIISKVLGIIYVIPFHAIIGEQGGALYGYAYTIYLIFMSLSSAHPYLDPCELHTRAAYRTFF